MVGIIVDEITTMPIEAINEIPEELLWVANFNSKKSIETYGFAIRQFMNFLKIDDVNQLRAVGHAHVIAFKKYLIDSLNKKPATVNNRLSAISSLFNHLIDQQICKINPAQGVRRLRQEYSGVKAKCLSRDEVRRILDIPDRSTMIGKRNYALLCVLFYTGCRISEVINLKIEDYFNEKGYPILDFKVKGGKRNRVAISKELEIALNDYLSTFTGNHCPKNPIFVSINFKNREKNHLKRVTVSELWGRITKKAGIYGTSPHSARTTFITEAMTNNCPIEAVQKTVGHSQIKTTQMYDKRDKNYKDSASFSVHF